MIIERRSLLTGKRHRMDLPVTQDQLDRWQRGGELIQRVFPNLSPAQREFILTGTTPREWAAAYPKDEDMIWPLERRA